MSSRFFAWLSARSAFYLLLTGTVVLLVALVPQAVSAKAKSNPNAGLCRPQKAQEFLKRPYFVRRGRLDAKRNDRSVRFRVERYGRIEGLGFEALNERTAHSQIIGAQFFGLGIQVHKAVAPALRCVERRIRKTCTKGTET